ncbi:MAG TPA: maleylpyruvate isomerase N-terminal domain-containing protein [Streptosporangiaceae bacterium]|nr:maleylpyruvate isomerase N-terminal domain-containing protein [Streptosporangiaceae bacterium]
MQTLSFPDALALIEDRSAALRDAAAQAGLGARVPGCPDWTVADLITHLGQVQLFWAATVDAGPAEEPPTEDAIGDREPHGDLLEWSAGATARLTEALANAGPSRLCWTWWEEFDMAPNTSGAVARHQVQEVAVHAFDAQQAAGHGLPLPDPVATDGVNEFITVELPTNGPWPYEPATVILETGPAGTWLLDLGPVGVRVLQGDVHGNVKATAIVTADPSDMVLAFYRRDTVHDLQIEGVAELVPQLINWPELD